MCDSRNFFGYETRRVGGNIHEDCSMLTERDIEKRHKIDMVCGNIKGNVNCTYTFVAGRSTSKLYCKSSAVAAGSGTSGTSLVPFYFESLELLYF